MTTLFLEPAAGPGTHIFLIGVGHYPHLPDGGHAVQVRKSHGMKQLESPPLSALAFLDWAVALNNSEAPLKSIEACISAGAPFSCREGPEGPISIAEATYAEVQTAAEIWYGRATSDPDNVAIFYFCGHGMGDGVRTQLLLSDYGAAGVPMRNAIDFNGFRLAMSQCAAQKQIFFVDACRTVDPTMLVDPNNMGSALLPADVTKVYRGANPAFFAAQIGHRAFAPIGRVSYFTSALIKGLNSYGVTRSRGMKWCVQPQQLQVAIATLMQSPQTPLACSVDGIIGRGFVIHEIVGPPQVLLDINLSVEEANPIAVICCESGGRVEQRGNSDTPWRAVVYPGMCTVSAAFPAGSPYLATPFQDYVFPPSQDIQLEVQ
jgi:hypothetical protein